MIKHWYAALTIVLCLGLSGGVKASTNNTAGETFYLEALSQVLEQSLEQQGVAPPLDVEEVVLVLKDGNRVVSMTEAEKLYRWKQFSLANITLNTSANRFTAEMVMIADKSGKVTADVIQVRGRIVKMAEIPVLRETLTRGDIITEDDLEWITVPEKNLRNSMIVSKENLVGKTPKYRLAGGKTIRANEVESPLVVRKGDALTISYQTPLMLLQTVGVALEDGRIGELINIQNSRSKKVIQARVESRGQAIVNYMNTNAELASAGF